MKVLHFIFLAFQLGQVCVSVASAVLMNRGPSKYHGTADDLLDVLSVKIRSSL